jgi:hypothetical protein
MTFSRVNPAGWVFPDPITAAQINALDIQMASALDGDAGGSSAPSADIKLPGPNGIEWGDGRWPKLTTRTVYRVMSMNRYQEVLTGAGSLPWTHDAGWVWKQATVDGAAPEAILFSADNLVVGGQLRVVRIWVRGAAGHVAMPTIKPIVTVYKLEMDGTSTTLGAATDGTSGPAGYEAIHTISVSFVEDAPIDEESGTRYIVKVDGEGGVNKLAGLQILGGRLEFKGVSELHPGG